MDIIIAIVSIVISSIYAFTIIVFAISFFRKKDDVVKESSVLPFVSIIIACRNEENNLKELIESLLNQDYQDKHEIIIIDDHSTDGSVSIIESYSDIKINLYRLPKGKEGKKDALRFGVNKSKGDVLVFTDADCILPENWLKSQTIGLIQKDVDMLCGPVKFKHKNSFFNLLFELEFMSLTGSGAAGFFINRPFMCNGANFSIKKESYTSAMHNINDKYSSGDDVFLLHHLSKTGKVDFLKNKSATVITNPPSNILDFFKQRIRWASKTTGYRDFFSIYIAITTFAASILLFALPIISIFNTDFWLLLIFVFLLKTISDKIFMFSVTSFYQQPNLFFLIPVLQIFYPTYIVTTVILSLIYRPYWKGRRIKR